eukprot:m.166314 g.166314  ORF g.166314 m.166314 type:complete len:1436 (+) comp12676_c0_seq1:372-4679(+)
MDVDTQRASPDTTNPSGVQIDHVMSTSTADTRTKDEDSRAANVEAGIRGPTSPVVARVDRVGVVSWLTVSWLTPLVDLSRRQPIDPIHVPDCPTSLSSAALHNTFGQAWEAELRYARAGPGRRPSLLRALFHAERRNVLCGAVGMALFGAAQVTMPLCIKGMLEYLTLDRWTDGEGAGFAIGLGLIAWAGAQSFLAGYLYMQRAGMESRASVMQAVYMRCLEVPAAEASELSLGSSTNLMSVDAEKLYLSAQYIHTLWLFPLLCVVVLGILTTIVGLSAVAGMVLIVSLVPIQLVLTRMIREGRKRAMRAGDRRVKYMSEILQHIRTVKLYAWEKPIEQRVADMRNEELKHVRSALFTRGWLREVMFATPQLVALVVFAIYIFAQDERADAVQLFEVMAFINALRTPSMLFAQCLSSVGEALVAVRRLEAFLTTTQSSNALTYGQRIMSEQPEDGDKVLPAMVMSNAAFTWNVHHHQPPPHPAALNDARTGAEARSDTRAVRNALLAPTRSDASNNEHTLRHLNLTIHQGELVAIVGVVGCGKTSIMHGMLGEIPLAAGSSVVYGNVAYAAQSPWIQNLTVRDNVLFGRLYDPVRYQAALHAACLVSDCALLPSGDLTEIGERGINLSGGQKARVAFARVLYGAADTNVILLDDPFSAVDGATGERMFRRGVGNTRGMLRTKTRIVSLNSHLNLLPFFDRILILEGGEIIADGPYASLHDKLGRFVKQTSATDGALSEPVSPAVPPTESPQPQFILPAHGSHDNSQTTSYKPTDGNDDAARTKRGKLVVSESRKIGTVSMSVYRRYFGAAVKTNSRTLGVVILTGAVGMFAIAQVLRMLSDVWLVKWIKDGSDPRDTDAFVFMGLLGAAVVVQIARVTILMTIATASARNMHNSVLQRVIRAPVSTFFDVTSTGEIINRFSSDLERVDMLLPDGIMQLLQNMLHSAGIVGLCIAATPILVAIVVPLAALGRRVFQQFRGVFRDLKRLESASRTPLYSTFGETLSGLSTIRAFSASDRFKELMRDRLDRNSSQFLHFRMASLWLMWRLDVVAASILLGLAVLLVLTKDSVDGSVAGLALVYAMQLTALLQRVVFIMIETETHMTSAERIFHYSSIEQEPPSHVPCVDDPLGTSWPSKGKVEFRNVSMRYRDNDLVLRDIDLCIEGGARVGVCGRTGAGKSSLFVALFRMNALAQGGIFIDGVDIASVGLEKLRRSIGIIPQDPTLLSGTLRFNIDPWVEQSDERIWEVLRRVRLAETVRQLGGDDGLDVQVDAGGTNFSQGERQLVCIARALLRSNVRLLVLDEATASIDAETDTLVQQAIREVAGDITTITIAHRLQSIQDADMICVMHEGTVAEYGPPDVLLGKPDGLYAAMAQTAGLDTTTDGADANAMSLASQQPGIDAASPPSTARKSVPFFSTSIPRSDRDSNVRRISRV